MTLFLYI